MRLRQLLDEILHDSVALRLEFWKIARTTYPRLKTTASASKRSGVFMFGKSGQNLTSRVTKTLLVARG